MHTEIHAHAEFYKHMLPIFFSIPHPHPNSPELPKHGRRPNCIAANIDPAPELRAKGGLATRAGLPPLPGQEPIPVLALQGGGQNLLQDKAQPRLPATALAGNVFLETCMHIYTNNL